MCGPQSVDHDCFWTCLNTQAAAGDYTFPSIFMSFGSHAIRMQPSTLFRRPRNTPRLMHLVGVRPNLFALNSSLSCLSQSRASVGKWLWISARSSSFTPKSLGGFPLIPPSLAWFCNPWDLKQHVPLEFAKQKDQWSSPWDVGHPSNICISKSCTHNTAASLAEEPAWCPRLVSTKVFEPYQVAKPWKYQSIPTCLASLISWEQPNTAVQQTSDLVLRSAFPGSPEACSL